MSQDSQKAKKYQQQVQKATPNSPKVKGLFRAFWVGGVICCIGQVFTDCGKMGLHMDPVTSSGFGSICMVFLGAFLTGIGVYDRIGKYAGGGSIVPITGFANSVVSPAMEYRREGLITGTAVKMFSIAGPVLVYGVLASSLMGLIYALLGGI